jgi:hypothetical protein
MSLIEQAIMFGHGGSGAYVLVAFVLGLVAIYMLWHGRRTLPLGMAGPLATALFVLTLARIPFWDWQLASLEASYLRLSAFSCMSLIGLFFVISALLKLTSSGDDAPSRNLDSSLSWLTRWRFVLVQACGGLAHGVRHGSFQLHSGGRHYTAHRFWRF